MGKQKEDEAGRRDFKDLQGDFERQVVKLREMRAEVEHRAVERIKIELGLGLTHTRAARNYYAIGNPEYAKRAATNARNSYQQILEQLPKVWSAPNSVLDKQWLKRKLLELKEELERLS